MNYFFKFLIPQLLEYFNDKNGANKSDTSNKQLKKVKSSKF